MHRKWKESLQQEAEQRLQENVEVIHKFIDYAAGYGITLQECDFSYVPTIGIVLK